ncbi:ROK family transcriptional regulator [Streptomyces sp. NPDC089919]|uniref:ROK family transcriptional regulator n=1 Tax=Streptomyces sp. NPDC089919 TaxID=3155188 RepID=UPI003420987B
MNDRAALDLLLAHGPLSRARIGQLTGLSKPTASQVLARLEEAGLVIAGGTSEGSPGPGAQLYAVNPAAAYVAGVDVTPGLITAAVADLTGGVLGSYELALPAAGAEAGLQQVTAVLDGATAAAGLTTDRLHRVVIGAPLAFDLRAGRLRYPSHLVGWQTPDLLRELTAGLPVPVECENDVNLVAVAEHRLGAARGLSDFFLLWNEEGIGGALMFGGRLFRGRTGGAGEVGFMPVPGTELIRGIDEAQTGGYQQLAGCQAVPELARSLGIDYLSELPELAHLRGADEADGAVLEVATALLRAGAAAHGGGPYRLLLERFATALATGLASVAATLDPELVVLAGGLLTAGGEPLRALLAAELAELSAAQPPLVLAEVLDRPVLRGALETALATTQEEVFDTSR